jgi:SAM-dependent methyltransferase
VAAAPRGRALDLGAGTGEAALWLARQGFLVDAVERDPERVAALRRERAGRTVVVHAADVREFPLASQTYALVLASAVLHFLRPSELWPLADRLSDALIPGGLLVSEALTTDDPEAADLRSASRPEVEPNTFALDPSGSVIHFFEPRELQRVFGQLETLEYEEFRRAAPEAELGYRSGATLVARRPTEEAPPGSRDGC